jgi:Uma2 family endonuclease
LQSQTPDWELVVDWVDTNALDNRAHAKALTRQGVHFASPQASAFTVRFVAMTAVRQLERPYTVEDLANTPDDGQRYEVIGGELVVSPAPSTKHQRVSFRLARIIGDYLEHSGTGEAFAAPLDVVLGKHDIVQPDLVVILRQHADRVTDAGIDGAPDIVIEITSPSSQRMDRIRKSATYATYSVPEYWIVDPDTETILVHELVDGQYQPVASRDGSVRSRQLPDLDFERGDVFALPERPGV